MQENKELSYGHHIYSTLSEALDQSGIGLYELIHFIYHWMDEAEDAIGIEIFLMGVLAIKANLDKVTGIFIDMAREQLGNDFVNEKMKNYGLNNEKKELR